MVNITERQYSFLVKGLYENEGKMNAVNNIKQLIDRIETKDCK